jgi:hypothetical protein
MNKVNRNILYQYPRSVSLAYVHANLRFEVFTTLKIYIVVYWDSTSCSFIGDYHICGETFRLHVKGESTSTLKVEAPGSAEPPVKLDVVVTQKITV